MGQLGGKAVSLLLLLLGAACGGQSATEPDGGDAGLGTSPLPVPDMSGPATCDVAQVHVALGATVGNSDFDYTSGCTDDPVGQGGPVGYFRGDVLVLSACRAPERGEAGIRFELAKPTNTWQFQTQSVAFVDPDLRAWAFDGPQPSGFGTTIEALGPVGGTISGSYLGQLDDDADRIYLMGNFQVCRAPDQPLP